MIKIPNDKDKYVLGKLKKFIYVTNCYGKPSYKDNMELFVKTFKGHFDTKSDDHSFKEEIKGTKDIFDKHVKDIESLDKIDVIVNGGFSWYEAIADLDFTNKTDAQIINELNAIPAVTDEDAMANHVHTLLNGDTTKSVPKADFAEHSNTSGLAEVSQKSKESSKTEIAKTSDKSNTAKEAEKANTSNKSNTSEIAKLAEQAKELTPDGIEKIVDIMMKNPIFLGSVSEIVVDKQEQKRIKEAEALRTDLNYTPVDLGTNNEDLNLRYNIRKASQTTSKLNKTRRAYIIGSSNAGKTHLSLEMASKWCNVNRKNVDNETKKLSCEGDNLLIVNASIGYDKFIGTEKKNGIFPKFCQHNANSEFCLLVINEAKKDSTESILKPIWDDLKVDYLKKLKAGIKMKLPTGCIVKIPRGLCILVNAATEDYTSQMENRFGEVIDLDDLDESCIDEISNACELEPEIVADMIKIHQFIRSQCKTYKNHHPSIDSSMTIYDLKKHTKECIKRYTDIASDIVGDDWQEIRERLEEYVKNIGG